MPTPKEYATAQIAEALLSLKLARRNLIKAQVPHSISLAKSVAEIELIHEMLVSETDKEVNKT